MRKILPLLGRILILLSLAIFAYFYASRLMDSIFAYRSPLRNSPPAPGGALGDPSTRRVVFVLIDALRNDTALKPQVMPVLNQLRQRAAVAMMHSRPPSYSEPGYTVLLTGAWPDLSDGPTINVDYDLIRSFTQDDLFSAAHRSGLKTAVSGYYWFEKLIPQAAVDTRFYTPLEDRSADRQVVDAALPWLRAGGQQLTLIHLDQVDYAGHHEGGPQNPSWDAAATRADALLGEILAELDLTQDTVLVVSDHGQIEIGGHGGDEEVVLSEPFVLAGAGVKPGEYGDVEQADVAPTLAGLLGTNLPATSQGRALSEMLALNPGVAAALPAAEEAQQAQLLKAFQAATGGSIPELAAGGSVATHQAAIQAIRLSRLRAEQLPRAILALALAILPAAWLLIYQRRLLVLLLGCGLLYIVLFNLRYALLDRRTYSLSSVTSSTDLILYGAVTTGLALLVSWLVFVFSGRVLRQQPFIAARSSLDLALTTIYLLFLPVLLSYAMNGLFVTWTLPDFRSMFLGFLSVVQVLFVAVFGLLLAGAAALVSSLRRKGATETNG